MALTVVGCGYTGRRLAERRRDKGEDVIALVRSSASREALDLLAIAAHRLDLDETVEGGLPGRFTSARRLVYMVPPSGPGAADERMSRFVEALTAPPACLVYLSTTAVYGDRGGATVDEETPPAPSSDRGRRRLDAERQLLAYGRDHDVRVRILRVPGIYGPGRLPLERIRRGAPVLAPDPSRPGNRIHVDDLGRAILAAARYDGTETIFNVGDGDPMDSGSFTRAVAREAGLAPPPTRSLAEMIDAASPMGREFLRESRRVETRRMGEVLGFRPRFTDPIAGIRASLDQSGPWMPDPSDRTQR